MTYDSIFPRSYRKHERKWRHDLSLANNFSKKLGCGALFCCLMIALTLCAVFRPYLDPLQVLKQQLSISDGLKTLMNSKEITEPQQQYVNTASLEPMCSVTKPRSDVCEINQDVRIHGNSSTIFVPLTKSLPEKNSWIIKPYARKEDDTAMRKVTKLTVKLVNDSQILPSCSKAYTVPGIVFSTAGYLGNAFHDFSDVLIPLYMSSRRFEGEVQFLVTNKNSWWLNDKYGILIKKLSNYNIINIDEENEVLCFPSMTVGLIAHKELSIDASKSSYSMTSFTQFLRTVYSLPRTDISLIPLNGEKKKSPRLLIIARQKKRRLTNANEVADAARSLGFEVVVQETTADIPKVSKFVNTFDVMMGVHGAGLTNMVFLPENAVVLQIIPLGGMEGMARTDYKVPAEDMNLRYLEYIINVNESSLAKKYPPDHDVLKNHALALGRGNWTAFGEVYMEAQDVELDVGRFRATLLKALELF